MKMKLFFVAMCISTVATSQTAGQMRYYEYNFKNKNFSQLYFFDRTLNAEILSEKNVSGLEITSELKKKNSHVTAYTFNPEGNVLSSKTKYGKSNFTYIQDSVLTEIKVQSKNKDRKTLYEHDSNFEIISETVFVNDKLKSKRTFEFDHGEVVKQTYLSGRNLNKTAVLEKKYNQEGKMIQTVFYKNGKIKNQWDYSCKPEGSDLLASKSNDLSNYCQYKEESADGSYKKYTRTIEKGKPYLFIAEYDKDSTFIRQDKFMNDSILVNSTVVTGNSTMTSYYKNNKFNYGYKTELNDDKLITKQEFYSGKTPKCTSANIYTYDANGLIVSDEYFRKEKSQRKNNYRYFFFE